ncbi:hypothetical protein E7Z59_04905 [Robertkochia marina]|uniref:Tetratricopeptide repeat protein n=1 Tax=Robertkochia marina TaxID=1227945 RepID=A0A4V3UYH8_9FLAO|nr:hypothetical protein [Robertkochia marina]THD69668.1 hypothetical protein E7Z59_04905 [Robertkochia marina]TRZ46987.1 hypothetical protein D3A96_05320 [Robertkochia marina]
MILFFTGASGFSQSDQLSAADSLFYFEIKSKADHFMQKDLDSALYYFDQLNTYLLERDYPRKRLRVLLDMGNAYLSKGQADRALET